MDDRNTKHLNKERLCYCCDKLQPTVDSLHIFKIEDRGYGSIFDESDFTIQLCDICKNYIDPIWFNERPTYDNSGLYFEEFKYEEEVKKFIDSWILENQEYIYNEEDYYRLMTRQDWIDHRKGILPDETVESYGFISNRQVTAYTEKFPTCNYPVNVTCGPDIKHCECYHGARGNYGQIADDECIRTTCYDCNKYIKRFEPIKEMDYDQYQRYKIYVQSKIDYLKLKDEFE